MTILSILWKPATDIKPEELIGKQCRLIETKKPTLVIAKDGLPGLVRAFTITGPVFYSLREIEYLDESPEAVKEMVKPLIKQAFEDGQRSAEIEEDYSEDIPKWEMSYREYSDDYLKRIGLL